MNPELWLWGLGIGALAALPLGPVGMVCVQRTLSHGARAGVASASGLVLASALWCLAAVQGLGLLSRYLPLNASAFSAAVGLLLVALALNHLLRPPAVGPSLLRRRELAGHFLGTLLVVLPNPLTLATVAALLAAFGLGQSRMSLAAAGEFALAVFAGGLALWLVLARLLIRLRNRWGDRATVRVSRLLSLFVLCLGLAYLARAVWPAR